MPITTRRNRSLLMAALSFLELLYHSVVREIRKQSGSAALGFLSLLLQNLVLLAVFMLIFVVLGMRTFAIRGDFIVFLLTGIFLYFTHIRVIQQLMMASPLDPMAQHAPMNSILIILAKSFAALYMQFMVIVLIVFFVHVLRGGLDIYNPAGLLFPFIMAWASGAAIGLVFLSLRPFAPKFIPVFSQFYRRINMVASGKMIPANYMSATLVEWFDWNPLFHVIDQSRGEAFVNYFPHRSNMVQPVVFTLVALMIGLMIEFWLRRNMSVSWGKRTIL